MKFNELSNEEIVFIQRLIGDLLSVYDKIIDAGGASYNVDTPLGKIEVFKPIPQVELDEIVTSDKVRLFNSINNKLSPIVDLIGDVDPGLIDLINTILHLKEPEDEDQKENL